ncbi:MULTISPECIES: electron transport complex subunit E [Shewanella]|jgi:electron transport complex protein RnfE|uniref:Ion-translocating oxidoreductase complex subunit E n=1 Tax=Shewanella vesiculosa TaxID=518738 RepID=A0ABV0FNB9_9GAMM|nr:MULTISPECIES: electron transport complex subunit E [Shewanella]NCQ45972.1 electron transport complex subunit E [Shewanella frigidimarina]MBB1321939.1 electron transport complex subunit E [Shewanella sp. SR43-8]MBB1391538.1 electron transport complex subunit E [Shewanella sp. SG44-6]MBB1476230.1 electron transport complex subunit E [Shewanella sp. SG41-3]NCO70430.1 electron transport complex subunit E [Shewanella vesiculosa]|tara:strand:- start:359 stop:1054 length:696 start_codon:yes stop_codon:yes gene_type:complete
MSNYREIAAQGLWKNNPGLVQLLGLCPLLAVTATITNALGLGVATLLVLVGSNILVSLVRDFVPKEIRIPVFVMIIAALVTCVQLLINAYAYNLYLSLGIFLPLIVTNCVIIGRAEAFASRNSLAHSTFDGLMMGLGFTAVLVVLGASRELIGQGTLFDGADLLLGDWASVLTIHVWQVDTPFLLAMLPPGAFIGMGLLIALKNVIDSRVKAMQPKAEVVGVTRARITKVN